MKILFVCQYYYPDTFNVTDVCEGLAACGHEITVLAGLPNYPGGVVLDEYRKGKKRDEMVNGVRVLRTFEIGRGQGNARLAVNYYSFVMSSMLKVARIKEDFDLVFVYQLSPVMMAQAAIKYQKKHKKPLFLYSLDLWPESLAAGNGGFLDKKSFLYKLFHKISGKIYRSADKIAVSSQSFIPHLEREFGINNIGYIPQFSGKSPAEAAERVNDSGICTLAFTGNIGKMQDIGTIIDAAKLLSHRNDFKIKIVGEGSALPEMKEKAKGVESVEFCGRVPATEVPRILENVDATLLTLTDNPTISLTLPAKVQTYMAAARPIIGGVMGEARQVIEAAQCGICCDPKRPDLLAAAIERFIETPADERQKMGENAYKYHKSHFIKDDIIDMFDKAIKDLAGC